jgi:undecaprenyl diphosphate synthase
LEKACFGMGEKLNLSGIPSHIAVIMDGNGRWAKKRGASRIFGHQNAIKAVREVTEGCAELGVKFLTLYAFSTENWNRPKLEVEGLMALLISTIKKEIPTLMKNNVKLQPIGNIMHLPKEAQNNLADAMEETKGNDGLLLSLALNYSGRWDITEAIKSISRQVKGDEISIEEIDENLISKNLNTKNLPDPELMIRTSGEFRISNYMLWQSAYTELYFTDVLWPDFRKPDLERAIIDFQKRERRFGKTGDQIKEKVKK